MAEYISSQDASMLVPSTPDILATYIFEHRKNHQRAGHELSPAGSFASLLMAKGREGLVDIQRKIDFGTERLLPRDMYSHLHDHHPELYGSFALNHAAIAYGAFIAGLAEAAAYGEFNMGTVTSKYNDHISNSGLLPWQTDTGNIPIDVNTLRKKATRDPSFSFAFSELDSFPAVEKFFRQTIRDSGSRPLLNILRRAPAAVTKVRDEDRRPVHRVRVLQETDRLLVDDAPEATLPQANSVFSEKAEEEFLKGVTRELRIRREKDAIRDADILLRKLDRISSPR